MSRLRPRAMVSACLHMFSRCFPRFGMIWYADMPSSFLLVSGSWHRFDEQFRGTLSPFSGENAVIFFIVQFPLRLYASMRNDCWHLPWVPMGSADIEH